MAEFAYEARKKSTGEKVRGVLEAADRSAALVAADRMGLFPSKMESVKGGTVARGSGGKRSFASMLPAGLQEALNRKRKPSMQELATYTRQLANLLHAGMPLTTALNSMSNIESKGIPGEVSKTLRQDITEGRTLSASMGRQKHIFTDLYVNMVQAGEQSGSLEDVLRRLASHYERFAEVQSRFISALIYPALVLCVGGLIIFAFMTFMLPKFMQIFEGMSIELPGATKFLIAVSNFGKSYWWMPIMFLFVGGLIFVRYRSTTRGRRALDGLILKMPLVGGVMRLNLFGQFARTLGTLLRNGVPVLMALKITEQVMANHVIKDALAKTREEVTDGKTIAQPLAKSKVFPQLMIDLLKIGEDTGDVPGALENVADTYESELNVALRVLTNLIEPIMIIVIAVFVGFLMYSVLSAMFAITRSIS